MFKSASVKGEVGGTVSIFGKPSISGSASVTNQDIMLNTASRLGRKTDVPDRMIIDSGDNVPRGTSYQPVFNNQFFNPNPGSLKSPGHASPTLQGSFFQTDKKDVGRGTRAGTTAQALVGLQDLITPEDYLKPQTKKVPRFGLVDLDNEKLHTKPLDFYEALEKKSDLLIEEMERQLNLLRKCDTITSDFRKETTQLKDRIRNLLENVKENLGLTNLKDIKDKIFAEIEELVKLCHIYRLKSQEANDIYKMLRDTFPYDNRRHSLIQNIDEKILKLVTAIGKDVAAMNRFMDTFKLQAKNEPFSQRTKEAAQDLLQRMQKYEPIYSDNQREIELIYGVQADIYEKEAASIEEEAAIFQASVEKINDGKLQLIQAAALEEPLLIVEENITEIVNQLKNLFDVADHPRYPRCPTLVKQRGYENIILSLLQRNELERAKIQKVRHQIKTLVDPESDKGLYFQKQKFKIRDKLDIIIRELEDQLDTNKNVLSIVKKIEKEESDFLNLYALSKDLNYESIAAAANSVFKKFTNSNIPPTEQEIKEISKLGAKFNILQAEFKNIKHRLEKLNLPQFRVILGKVFPGFAQKIEAVLKLCAQQVEQLLSLKIVDSNILSEIDKLNLQAALDEYERYREVVTKDLTTLEYNRADAQENERKKYESVIKKKNSQLQELIRKCRNEDIKRRHRAIGERFKAVINEIELLGEIIESGMHIVDILRETNTPEVYGNQKIKVMLSDKIDRIRQISHRLEKVLSDRTVDVNLGVLPKFTITQNQVFVDIFVLLLDHFNKEIPNVIKTDPGNVELCHQKFKKNLRTELEKVDKVNVRAQTTLNGLTKIWQKGLSEIKPQKDDPDILLSSYVKTMKDIFSSGFMYRIIDYSLTIPKINFLVEEVKASSFDSTRKKQIQSELQFIQTAIGRIDEKFFRDFIPVANPFNEGGSRAANQLKQHVQQTYTAIDSSFDPNDTKLANSEYIGSIIKWRSMLIDLLESLKQYANAIAVATAALEEKKTDLSITLPGLLRALGDFAFAVESAAKECWAKCSKIKIEIDQSWFYPRVDELKLIREFNTTMQDFESMKGALKILLFRAQDEFTEVSKKEMLGLCKKLIFSLDVLKEMMMNRWIEGGFRKTIPRMLSMFESVKNHIATWRNMAEELQHDLEKFEIQAFEKKSEVPFIKNMAKNVENTMTY